MGMNNYTRIRSWCLNLGLVMGSLILTLLAVEMFMRDYRAGFFNLLTGNGRDVDEQFNQGLYKYDPDLGWVPRSNIVIDKWGEKVTTLDDGLRSNGGWSAANGKTRVLVVGDSFTFGDNVSDESSWPALLERQTGFTVLNGGVSSYGLDQQVLRAEKLIPKYKPDIVILSFILDDLRRTREYVRHGVPKPYCVVENGSLVIRNQPVPLRAVARLDWFRSVCGYSYLCNFIMRRIAPAYWYAGTMLDIRSVSGDTMEISRLLFQRLLEAGKDVPRIIVVVQGALDTQEKHQHIIRPLLEYIRTNLPKLELVNLLPDLLDMQKDGGIGFYSLYLKDDRFHHMSPGGNAFVAFLLAQQIARAAGPVNDTGTGVAEH